jgi:hypothetical protein
VDEFFNELHVLATHMLELPDEYLLQVAISGLKENIRNELKMLDINDIEQAQLKARIVEEKLMSLQQVSWSHSEKPNQKYIPPNKRISPSDVKDDKNWCFRCHAPNWRPGHKCKNKKFYLCEVQSDNNKEIGNSSPSNTIQIIQMKN